MIVVTKYYWIPEKYKKDIYVYENDELRHFDFKFPDIKLPSIKIPDVKLPDIGRIIDDAGKTLAKSAEDIGKNVAKGLDDAAKSLNDAGKTVSNAVSGTLGSLLGREWKNHKWIARKRDKNGKWIYDYGDGFPGEKGIFGKNGGVSPEDIKLYEPSMAEKILTPLVGLGKALTGASLEDIINGGKEFVGGFLALGKRLHSNAEKEKAGFDSSNGLRRKASGDKGKDYDLANANPEWDLKDGGSQSNCPCCSFAYDLRRRGYEVTAKQTRTGLPENQITSFYKDPDVKTVKPKTRANINQSIDSYRKEYGKNLSRAVEEQFKSEPDNSRGVCWMTWSNGSGGHIVAYEKENGVTKLYDAQSGEKLNINEYVDNASDFKYYRTDNLEPNYDMMKKVVE